MGLENKNNEHEYKMIIYTKNGTTYEGLIYSTISDTKLLTKEIVTKHLHKDWCCMNDSYFNDNGVITVRTSDIEAIKIIFLK